MTVKAVASLNSGWRCAWVNTEYFYGDSGAGAFQVVGMDAEHRTEEILERFETIVRMRTTHHFDHPTENYDTDKVWEVGEIRIRKHNGPLVSMVVNDARVLMHVDCEVLPAIIKATRKAIAERQKRWDKEDELTSDS